MFILDKRGKVIIGAVIFILIAAAGVLVEKFEGDAFIKETVATEEDLPYVSSASHMDNGKININSADEEELCALDGIGPSLAKRIIEYRSENGPFISPADIMKVSGISEKKFEIIKEDICAE